MQKLDDELLKEMKELLITHEGISYLPYKCPAGFKTIGVGWNMDVNPLPVEYEMYLSTHKSLSYGQVMEMLEISILNAFNDCVKLFPSFDKFPNERKKALIDLLFNLGYNKFSKFTKTIAAVEKENWKEAADELEKSKWYGQVGIRSRVIVRMIRNG